MFDGDPLADLRPDEKNPAKELRSPARWDRIVELAEGLGERLRVGRGEHGLDVGDHVRVELVHTDVERGFIDFARS